MGPPMGGLGESAPIYGVGTSLGAGNTTPRRPLTEQKDRFRHPSTIKYRRASGSSRMRWRGSSGGGWEMARCEGSWERASYLWLNYRLLLGGVHSLGLSVTWGCPSPKVPCVMRIEVGAIPVAKAAFHCLAKLRRAEYGWAPEGRSSPPDTISHLGIARAHSLCMDGISDEKSN